MHETKATLIATYGTRCMLCRKDVGRRIQWHHMKPKYAKGNNSVRNGSLICDDCHKKIHQFVYGTEEYSELMSKIEMVKGG